MKRIISDAVSLKVGEFKQNGVMTDKLPAALKSRIMDYLQGPPLGIIGDVALVDPVTGVCYDHTSVIREKDGFTWNTHTIYMLKHYDVRLAEEFLNLFR